VYFKEKRARIMRDGNLTIPSGEAGIEMTPISDEVSNSYTQVLQALKSLTRSQDAASVRLWHDNKSLWLFDGHVCDQFGVPDRQNPGKKCSAPALRPPPGRKDIDGSTFGAMKYEDIIIR
jgi:hypothetical protein